MHVVCKIIHMNRLSYYGYLYLPYSIISIYKACAELPNRAGENPDNACAICYTSVGKVNTVR